MTNPHSDHYRKTKIEIEPIDVLCFAPFALGNCIKYILRAGHKGEAAYDIAKARTYLNYVDGTDANVFAFFDSYGPLLRKWQRLRDVHCLSDLERVIDEMSGIAS